MQVILIDPIPLFLRFYFFIHERERERQREKQAPCRKPDVGLDPRTPVSRPGLKAGVKPVSHPGVQNQTRNCWQNYLDFHRCEKAMTAKGGDVSVCEWYRRVYKSLCPISWVSAWDDRRAEGTFPGKI
ncbi:unnamed protein product [Nyctereutes procyonoides]|uniref:Cytochrome c oxidase subunit 6B1 n=1 Tax=Nyctereutes procyonoides TaxID=34880 RepID=A0A811Z053_NYCPR|nr:unnamed protein product [Nyctereutes procyonoides]